MLFLMHLLLQGLLSLAYPIFSSLLFTDCYNLLAYLSPSFQFCYQRSIKSQWALKVNDTFPFSKHFCKFLLRPSSILLKFFNQEPWTKSRPGTSQFGIFFNIFLIFSGEMSISSCFSLYSKSLFEFLSHFASFLSSFLSPRYSPKIPVCLSYHELLSLHSSFVQCWTPNKTFFDCS